MSHPAIGSPAAPLAPAWSREAIFGRPAGTNVRLAGSGNPPGNPPGEPAGTGSFRTELSHLDGAEVINPTAAAATVLTSGYDLVSELGSAGIRAVEPGESAVVREAA